ncbi:endonuclease/exonuclease/phosphatase family protein [Nocardioides nitrophenolicus]|uniref:endonuclease/exonuclease/phosphatase family protein n=1 Tax=Nocardioides nitrophenolicus TaxID=60489 RepID=UPI001958524A|nr:endonuclease/exonuclease/phosphatase family protein [Nocardioides nitrophenolicus]MBM7520011.1 endonuclease/exonuclease/phosphatase family metal-dependent hydrolase [Nocardioides nitrophenolicus]
MRIVSVNAWGGARYDDLAAWLPASGADVVCLQEVTRTPGLAGWTSFADGERSLPQRADLHADVRRLLPSYEALFLASDAGPVTDDAGHRHQQDFGLGTYLSERLPVVGMAGGFVHGGFVDHDEWTIADRPRAVQAVRVVDRAAGRTVCVVQLHGLRDPAGKGDTPARKEQAERIADFVEATRDPGDLVVLAGDLNLLPDSSTFEVLRGVGLHDLVGTADTRTSAYPKPVRHASYLLVSDPEAVAGFRVRAEPEVSDHRILELDLRPVP